jgi:hypothetical protein
MENDTKTVYKVPERNLAATITSKNFGIACSAIATYSREMEKEINRRKRFEEDKNSQYVGEIKTHVKVTATLVHTTELESQYGVTHLYKFKDENSNVLVWFASNIYWNPITGQDIVLGDVVVLDATVKGHEEYKGRDSDSPAIKQTIITRCKAWQSPEEKKAAAKARKIANDARKAAYVASLPQEVQF